MLCPEILPKTKGTLGFTQFCPAGVTSVKCFEPSLEKVSALGGDGVYMKQWTSVKCFSISDQITFVGILFTCVAYNKKEKL